MTMRSVWVLMLGLGWVVLSVLVGSWSVAEAQELVVPTEALPDGPGKRGGSVTLDLPAEPETFNPILSQGTGSQAVTALLHATLFEPVRQPTLVNTYDRSADNTVWTLFLRQGLRFSDGEPMTCADVAFTFNDVLFNEDVASAKEIWRVNDAFPTVECVDDYTVRITTPAPVADVVMTQLLSYQVILPRNLLDDQVHKLNPQVRPGHFNTVWGVNTPPEQIAGLGPFRLASYDPGQRVVLERNPHYWKVDPERTQLPYLDRIRMPIVRDYSVRVLNYLNGQTDVLRPRPEDVFVIRDRGLWVETLPPGVTDSHVFILNQDAQDPALRAVFREVRFRQAMSHSADRQSMIALGLNGYGEARCGPGIDPMFWHGTQDNPDFPCYPAEEVFDPDRAAQILDELRLTDIDGDGTRNITDAFLNQPAAQRALASLNTTLEELPSEEERELRFDILTLQGSKPLETDAEIYAETLQSLGLDVRAIPVPSSTLNAKLRDGSYQVARVDLLSNGDPSVIADIYVSVGRRHFWKPSDVQGEDVAAWQRRVDEIFAKQKAGSSEERQAWMKAFQELVAVNVPMIFLYNISDIQAYRKDRLGNFKGITGQATLLHSEYLFRKDL